MKKSESIFCKESLITIVVLIILYVLLGNINAIKANPMVPGAVVAVNMIIVVLAGILFGKRTGLAVGLFGTSINALITGSGFEYAAIIPHAIMGWFAGWFKERAKIFWSSFAILIGHALNIVMFLITGLLPASVIAGSTLWIGLTYEAVFGIVSITLLAYLYQAVTKSRC
jgi:uncharacterized membrane protein